MRPARVLALLLALLSLLGDARAVTVSEATVTWKETILFEDSTVNAQLLFGAIRTQDSAYVDPAMVHSGCAGYGCLTGAYCSGSSTLLPCCSPSDCDYSSSTSASASSSSSSTCTCPSSEDVTCFDANTPVERVDLAEGETKVYQVGVQSACHNVMITLTTFSGHQVVVTSPADAAYTLSLSDAPSKGLVYCCAGPSDSHPLVEAGGNATTSLYVGVYGYIAGTFSLAVSEIDPTKPYYPTETHYFFANVSLVCPASSSPATSALDTSPVLLTDDPGYSAFTVRAAPVGSAYTLDAFLPSVGPGLALGADGSDYTRYSIPACTATWIGVYDKDDLSATAENLTVPLTPTLAGDCSLAAFSTAQAAVLDVITQDLARVSDPDEATALAVLTFALATNDELLACVDLVENTLSRPAVTNISVTNSLACPYVSGSAEYATDPCCNATVAFLSQCCLPRSYELVASAGALTPNALVVNDLCTSPDCAAATIEDYSRAAVRQRDSTVGCDAELTSDFTSLTSNFYDPVTNVVAYCNAQVNGSASCTTNSDCKYTKRCVESTTDLSTTCLASANDTLFLNCVLDQIAALPAVYATLAAGFSRNFSIDLSDRATAVPAIVAQGLAQVCFVNGLPLYSAALVDNATACAQSTLFCNWDPTNELRRTKYACEELPPVAGTGYCALTNCTNSTRAECYGRSFPGGCFANPDFYAAYKPNWLNGSCPRIGGIQDPGSPNRCFLPDPTKTTPATCNFNPSCVLNDTLINALNCNCATIGALYPVFALNQTKLCQGFAFTDNKCQFIMATPRSPMQYDACVLPSTAGRVKWESGGAFVAPILPTSLACTAKSVCVSNLTLSVSTQCVTCNASVCRGSGTKPDICMNLVKCSLPTCTDFEFRAPYSSCNGGCVTPFSFDSAGQRLACTAPATGGFNGDPAGAGALNGVPSNTNGCYADTPPSSPLGCIQGAVATPQACAAIGGRWYTAAANQSECLSRVGCRVNSTSQLTVMNATACARCGSTETFYQWTTFGTRPDAFVQLEWEPVRALVSAGSLAPALNRPWLLDTLQSFMGPRISEITQNYLYCTLGRQQAALSLLACDCGSPGGSGCYSSAARTLGVAQLCSSEDGFSVPPVSIVLANTQSTSRACAQMQIGLYASSALQTRTVRLYSSLFLQSLVPDSYSVVKNSRGIVIGQLIGDVVQLTLTQPYLALKVCVETREGFKARYPVLDFASIDASYKAATLRPLGLDAASALDTDADGKEVACLVFDPSGLCAAATGNTCTLRLVPIYRSRSWDSDRFIDTLTRPQVNAFFVAAALYWLLFVGAVFRVVNFALWYFLKPQERVNLLGLCVLSVLSVFFFLRGIYFILVPVGVMRHAPIALDLLIAELPTYLFFTVFTMMVLWWIQLYHDSASLQTSLLGRMYPAFFVVNGFLYAFLLAVIIVVAVRSNRTNVEGACDAAETGLDKVSDHLAKAYKIIISVIALALAVGFLVYGTRLVMLLRRMTSKNESKANIIKFAIVTAACSLGLILQCVLLLYSTFAASSASNTRTVVAISLLLIIELLPGAALVSTMRQPRVSSTNWFWSNVAWCWADPATQSTSLSSSSRRSGQGL